MPDLVYPGDERYALSRNQFIGLPREILPRVVARCATAADVREALSMTDEFAVRGGGHSNACHSSSHGMVIDLSPADDITVDGDHVTVGGGVRVGQLARVLAPLERLVPSGSCPSVGLVGATLGGGFGSHGRMHGLTCDHLVSAEVVLADGRVVSADDDLLWAMRGGGCPGVVTQATYRTVPSVARTHVRYAWPFRHAAEIIQWWQGFAQPDDVALELILLCSDYLDEEPQVMVIGTAPGIDIGIAPTIAETVHLSATDAALRHPTPASASALDPISIPLTQDRPGMCTARTEFFAQPIPAAGIEALLARFTAERVHGELREVAFTPWGGAYARVPADATAFPHRNPTFLAKHTILTGPRGAAERSNDALAWLNSSWAAIHPYGTGGCYSNFPGADPLTSYYGANLDRLRAVWTRYDPTSRFRPGPTVRI